MSESPGKAGTAYELGIEPLDFSRRQVRELFESEEAKVVQGGPEFGADTLHSGEVVGRIFLAGKLAPLAGSMFGAKRVDVGYFAQHQLDELDPEGTARWAREDDDLVSLREDPRFLAIAGQADPAGAGS